MIVAALHVPPSKGFVVRSSGLRLRVQLVYGVRGFRVQKFRTEGLHNSGIYGVGVESLGLRG